MQRHLVEIRDGRQRVSHTRPSLSRTATLSTPTARSTVSLRAISHPSSVTSNRKTTLSTTDGEAMDTVDPDTETKCDSCCASSEHLILCVEVITQAVDRRNSQKYTHFLMIAKFLR